MDQPMIGRAYRVPLDPTPAQHAHLIGHCGASRSAFNTAHAAKREARKVWRSRVRSMCDEGMTLPLAMKAVKVKIPGYNLIDKARVRVRGTGRSGKPEAPNWGAAKMIFVDGGIEPEIAENILASWSDRALKSGLDPATQGIAPWQAEYPNALVQQAEKDCDEAWRRFMSGKAKTPTGKKKRKPHKVTRPCGGKECHEGPCSCKKSETGRCSILCHCRCDCEPAGFPRFKRKGDHDSFYLSNIEFRLVDGSNRRLRLGGKLGEVRTLEGTTVRKLRRAITKRGAVIQRATVVKSGRRWYVSITVLERAPSQEPTRAQVARGTVGVDLGIKNAMALSDGTLIQRPEADPGMDRAIIKAQRVMSRRVKFSKNWHKAAERLAHLKHLEAERRKSWIHGQTKKLATMYATVVIEDLNVSGMTASAKGTDEAPGKNVRQKAGLNRRLMNGSFYEVRRQIEYKAGWYGSRVIVADRWFASSKICCHCLVKKTNLRLSDRVFKCDACGNVCDRDVNAARNLVRCATSPMEDGKTLNPAGGNAGGSA